MFAKRWVAVSLLGLGVVGVSCAEEEGGPNLDDSGSGASSGSAHGGSSAGQGGKAAAGSSTQGGKAGSASGGASGGKAGTTSGGAAHAGTATAGGNSHAGTASAGNDSGGSAGTSSGGSATTGMGCLLESAGGAATGGAPNDGTGGDAAAAGAAMTGGGADAGPAALFFDDFETGNAAGWTTSLGTWALVDDGSKVYEQSLLENKLQLASVSDSCFADQIITARVKVTEFKGQSNSYVAALFGRVLGPQTHYLLALGSDKKLILRKRINSTSTSATAIGTAASFSVATDQWYDVRLELIGTSLKGCVADVCVSGTDSSIASGGVAVGTVNTSARFDDVRVVAP